MRVLQINCVYDKGSTGRIVSDLHRFYLNNGIDSYVLYGRGKQSADKNVEKVATEIASKARSAISRITGNVYGMAISATAEIIKAMQRINPDIVHLHCINGSFCNVFRLLAYLKENRIPTVITQHAEFLYTGNCGYAFDCEQWKTGCLHCSDSKKAIGSINTRATEKNWKRMKDAFEGFDNLQLIGVSDWITDRSNQSLILGEYSCKTVMNGLDAESFSFRGKQQSDVKEVIFVSPYFEDDNKGGKWLLKLAEETESLPIHYTVVGRASQTYSKDNISFQGVVTDKRKLAGLYSAADVCLLTSRRETFSMVCAEALSCGTPVVGFEAGAPETICMPEYSEFVPYGDTDRLKSALSRMLDRNIDKQGLSEKARERYSSDVMAQNYISVYQAMI